MQHKNRECHLYSQLLLGGIRAMLPLQTITAPAFVVPTVWWQLLVAQQAEKILCPSKEAFWLILGVTLWHKALENLGTHSGERWCDTVSQSAHTHGMSAVGCCQCPHCPRQR